MANALNSHPEQPFPLIPPTPVAPPAAGPRDVRLHADADAASAVPGARATVDPGPVGEPIPGNPHDFRSAAPSEGSGVTGTVAEPVPPS
jgi:hypothetical protein